MNAQQTEKTASGRKNTIILIIGLALIIALLGVIAALLLGRGSGEAEEPKRNVVINEENANQIIIDMKEREYVPAGYFEANMNSTWYFPDGASPSENAYVGNVDTNSNDIYFDVELADTGEVILESPIIPLGSHLSDITLDKDLDPGTYDCILIYHLVDGNQKTLSTLRMTLTIIVEG